MICKITHIPDRLKLDMETSVGSIFRISSLVSKVHTMVDLKGGLESGVSSRASTR
jgi:hypothetical protein